MTRNVRFIHRFLIEQLERRDLLCGVASDASASSIAAHSAPFTQAQTTKAVASSAVTKSADSNEISETHLFATLTNSSNVVVGTAFFETGVKGTATTQELLINVAGAASNASYVVTSGTTNLGTLITDANGNGRLYLTSISSSSTTSSATSSANKGTLPAGFTLAAGATIGLVSADSTIDALNGTFATASGDLEPGGGHGNHGCGGDNLSISRFTAPLTNAGASAGRAVFSTITQADGTATQILKVHVTGAAASTALDVSVDGTSVGSIMTDADGNGHLILSSSPSSSSVGQLPAGLTISSTSTISVGTSITGDFSSTASERGHHHRANSGAHSTGGGSTSSSPTASIRSSAARRR